MPSPPFEPPAVTLLMGTYNSEAFLERSLDRLLAQDYGNLRFLLHDDASTDNTAAICEAYAARDPRIQFRRNRQNIGWLENYRQLVLVTDTPYVCFAFHDDFLEPSYVRQCVARLEANPAAVVAYSDMRMFCPGGDVVLRHTVQSGVRSPLRRAMNVMLHRNDWWIPFRGVCRLPAAQECIAELTPHLAGDVSCDWLWMLRLATLGEMERVPEVLYIKHMRPAGVTLRWRNPPHRNLLRRVSALRTIRAMRLPPWQKAVLVGGVALSIAQIPLHGVARRIDTAIGPFRRRQPV